jgi:hypothetical protein
VKRVCCLLAGGFDDFALADVSGGVGGEEGDGGDAMGIFRSPFLLGFYSVEGGWFSGGGVLQAA